MNQTKKILCMYSGGLDSLGVLYLLVTDTKYESFGLHVHHLNLKNRENRILAEHKAIKDTLAYFRNNHYRNFFYTESSHDYSFMRKYFTFDTYWYAFMAAGIITADNTIRHVAVGRTKTDIENAASMNHAKRGHEIFHATLDLDKRFTRTYIYPVAHMTKKEIWDMLPADLRELSWSCRRPVNQDGQPHPCGECDTCKTMAAIKTAAQAAGR